MSDSKDSNVRTFTIDAKHLKVSAPRPTSTHRGLPDGGLTRRASRMSGGSAPAPTIEFDRAPASLASQTRVSEVIQTAGNPVAASPEALTVRTVPAPAISGNGGMGGLAASTQTQTGGSQAKVILGGKKNRTKVMLSQKRNRAPTVNIPVAGGVMKPAHKKTRKITIKLQGLKRRMTKARKTARMSKTLPISHIRKELMDRKLIKGNSKAPEGILRTMYSDAKIVANKSL